jgi:ribosome assembly protein YihI (activator of Der GTPase)
MGSLGPRKADTPKPVRIKDLANKKRKGLKAGSKHNIIEDESLLDDDSASVKANPRVGSKKPISLHVENTEVKKTVKKKPSIKDDVLPKAKVVKPIDNTAQIEQWQAELDTIEQDVKLQDLLEQYENGKKLSAQDLTYVNKLTSKHASLLEKLGIDDELDEDDDDLLDSWDDGDIKGDWS